MNMDRDELVVRMLESILSSGVDSYGVDRNIKLAGEYADQLISYLNKKNSNDVDQLRIRAIKSEVTEIDDKLKGPFDSATVPFLVDKRAQLMGELGELYRKESK